MSDSRGGELQAHEGAPALTPEPPDGGETPNQARAPAAPDLAAVSPQEWPAGRPSENIAARPLLRRSERVRRGTLQGSPARVPELSRMANSGPRRAGALGEDKQATGSASEGDQGSEVKNWTQCDRCQKWRHLPESIQDEVDAAEQWFCTMAPGITCDDAEEKEEEEEDADDDEETASAAPKRGVASLSRTEIESYFGLTQRQAAVQIGCRLRTLQYRCSALGISWPRGRMTDAEAMNIFRRGFQGRTRKTAAALALEYGISATSVYQIWRCETYQEATRYSLVFKSTGCMPLYSNYIMALTSGIVGSALWEEAEAARARQEVRFLSVSHTQTHASTCMFNILCVKHLENGVIMGQKNEPGGGGKKGRSVNSKQCTVWQTGAEGVCRVCSWRVCDL